MFVISLEYFLMYEFYPFSHTTPLTDSFNLFLLGAFAHPSSPSTSFTSITLSELFMNLFFYLPHPFTVVTFISKFILIAYFTFNTINNKNAYDFFRIVFNSLWKKAWFNLNRRLLHKYNLHKCYFSLHFPFTHSPNFWEHFVEKNMLFVLNNHLIKFNKDS